MKNFICKTKKINLKLLTLLIFAVMLLSSLFFKPMISTISAQTYEFNDVKSFILMSEDGQILAKKGENEKLPIASMTKTMTLLLTFEELDKGNIKLDEIITVSDIAAGMGGSQVFLEANGEYSINDLIKSIVVSSANDASVALSERIAGSEEAFVKRMNEKAKSLSLKNTQFANCTGLPAPLNYSSAIDVATIFENLSGHKEYFNYTKIWMDEIKHKNDRVTGLSNTNKLLKQYPDCDAGKTGSTNEAGFCIAATAVRNDMRLYAVVVGAKDSKLRFETTKKLFNFGFDNYEKKVIVNKNDIVKVEVSKGKENELEISAKENFVLICKKGEKRNFETKTVIEKDKAPVKQGERIGQIKCIKDGVVVKEIELVANKNIDKMKFKDYFKKVTGDFLR